ncbi:MAG: carboxypeptidase-like regulatory domain-containing protein [bacterium]
MVNKNYKRLALLLCVLAMGMFIFGCSKGLVGDNTYRSTTQVDAANPNNPVLALRGEIQGIVKNVYGRPLQGMVASMAYENGDGVCKTRTATTDEYGHYNFLNVPVSGTASYDAVNGTWAFTGTSALSITVKDPNATYVTHYESVSLDYQTLEQDSQIVTAGSELQVVGSLLKEASPTTMLRPIATVIGKVQNKLTGAALSGATVALSMNAGLNHDMPNTTAITDAAGEFSITNVPENDLYDLTIYANGYQTIRLFGEVPVPKGSETILVGQPEVIAYADADAMATTGFSPGADGINATAYELLPGAPTPDSTPPYTLSTNIPKFGTIPTALLSGPFTVAWSEPMDTTVGTVSITTTAFKGKAPIPIQNIVWTDSNKTMTITPTTPIPAGMMVTFAFNGFRDVFGNQHNGYKAAVILPALPSIAEDATSRFLGALDPQGRIPVGSVLALSIATTSQGSSTLIAVANFIQRPTLADPTFNEGGPANYVPQPNNFNNLDPTGMFIGPLGGGTGEADTVTMGWDAAAGARRYNVYAELNTGGFLNGLPQCVYATNTSGNPPTTVPLQLSDLEGVNFGNVGGFDLYNSTQLDPTKKIPHIGPATANSPFGGLNLTNPSNPNSAVLEFFDNGFSLVQMAATAFNSEGQEGGFSNIVSIMDNVQPVVADNSFGFDEAGLFYGIPAPVYAPPTTATYMPLFAMQAADMGAGGTANGFYNTYDLRVNQTGALDNMYNATSWAAASKAHGLDVLINEDVDTTQTLPTLTISTTGACTITSASIPGNGVNRSMIKVNLSNITVLETGAAISFAGVKDEAGLLVPSDFTGKLKIVDRMGPFFATAVTSRTAGPTDTLTMTFQEAINDTDAKAVVGTVISHWCYQSYSWVGMAFGGMTAMPAMAAAGDVTVSTDKKTVTAKFPDGSLSGILAQGAAIFTRNVANTLFVRDLDGNSFTNYGFLVKDEIAPRIVSIMQQGGGGWLEGVNTNVTNPGVDKVGCWRVGDTVASTVNVQVTFTEPVVFHAGGGAIVLADAQAQCTYAFTVGGTKYNYPAVQVTAVNATGTVVDYDIVKNGSAAVAALDKVKFAAQDKAANILDTGFDEIEITGAIGGGYTIK